MGILQKIFGSKNQRELKKMQPIVARIETNLRTQGIIE